MTEIPAPAGAAAPVVLVIEAEPLLRLMAVEMIEEAGYAAIGTRSIDAAIAILEARTDIRIVFTDIDMPRAVDGMRLAACIRDRWPPIEIILTSGGAAPVPCDMPLRSVFMPKPYSARRLTDMVRRMAA